MRRARDCFRLVSREVEKFLQGCGLPLRASLSPGRSGRQYRDAACGRQYRDAACQWTEVDFPRCRPWASSLLRRPSPTTTTGSPLASVSTEHCSEADDARRRNKKHRCLSEGERLGAPLRKPQCASTPRRRVLRRRGKSFSAPAIIELIRTGLCLRLIGAGWRMT